MRNLAVLGSTGSIGLSTLDVVARNPDKFNIAVLTANRSVDLLFEQCLYFMPDYAVMVDPDCAVQLQKLCHDADIATQVLSGSQSVEDVASLDEVDDVMAAIVGAAGLPACMAAAEAGKRILLANKEALVMAGDVFMSAVKEGGATLLPIDSEHNAIFQCWPHQGSVSEQVRRIVLTASGGPFRGRAREELLAVTPDQACAHPNWEMGRKISVDSATMMNKGLEVIEACWLFDLPVSQVEVVVHPQSVVHSMVEYVDGSTLAELGHPDMRTPIAHALAWPETRIDAGVGLLDLAAVGQLNFESPDYDAFPCLALAMQAAETGGVAPAILNAANEVAVSAFLGSQLGFLQIANVVEEALNVLDCSQTADDLESVLKIDRQARDAANQIMAKIA